MAGVLGRAFVQVFADLSKFTPGLREEIKKALDEQTKGLKFEELDKSAEKAGESAAAEIDKGVGTKVKDNMDKKGKEGGSSLMKGLSAGVSGAMAAFLPILISLGVEVGAALAPAALAIGGTLPAAIFTLVGAMAVLKLATSGVGAAIKDSLNPANAKKFAEEMKKLAPAARSFVLEIKNLHPAFHQLQQDVQQVFFTQLKGILTQVTRELLPTLHTGLRQMATDLGQTAAGLANAFGWHSQDIASIFLAAHEALRPFIPLVGQLVGAFLAVGAVAGPLFASLSGGFANLLGQLVDFLNAEADSGGMAKFFDDALVILKQFGSLLGNVFGLVMQILGALQQTGAQGLGALSRIVGMLGDFFASAQGHEALVAIFNLLNVALNSLFQILTPLLPAVGQLATILAGGLAAAIIKLTPYLVDITDFLGKHPALIAAAVAAWATYNAALKAVAIYEGIVDALDPLTWIVIAVAAIAAGAYLIYRNWGAIAPFFKGVWDAIIGFLQGIWNWITSVGRSIGNWFTVTLPGFFASLPGRIGAALASIPGLLQQLFLLALKLAGESIGIGVGLVIAYWVKFPGLLWEAVKAIGHLLADLWRLAFATGKAVLTAEINVVIFVFATLPGKIATWMGRIPGVIVSAFRTAWSQAKSAVESGANDIVNFVRNLPKRLSGFMNNVGHDILGGLKDGINAVIGGFNSGIDRVAGVIHIGLPHLPMLAGGGLINAPTLAVVGEAGPEAVIPMSDPARAAAVAQKTGLLDLLGSKMGSAGTTLVKVYLGTREITDILDVRIDKKMNDQANELAYGTRG